MPRTSRPKKAEKQPETKVESVLVPTDGEIRATALSDLFTSPNKKLSSDLFFNSTAEYQPTAQVAWYLYRLWPVIDRKLGPLGPSAKSYIDKLSEPLTAEGVLRKWGSGDYKICFTDAAQPRGKTQIAHTIVQFRDDAHPPVLDLSELVLGDPQNASFIDGLRQRGLWAEEGANLGDQTAVAALSEIARENIRSGDRSVPREAVEVMADAARRANEMPMALLQAVLPMMNGGGNGNAELIRVMAEEQRQTRELLTRLIESSKVPTPSVTDTLKQYLEIQQMVRQVGGRQSNPAPTSWTDHLPAIIEGAQRIAAPIMLGLAQQRAAAPAPVIPMVPNAQVVERAPGHAAPVHQMPSPAVNAPQAVPADAMPPVDPGMVSMLAGQVLAAIERGFGGDDFALNVCMNYGDDVYGQVRSMGLEGLQMVLSDPAAAAVLEPVREQLPEFLRAFLAYGDGEEEESNKEGADVKPMGMVA